MSKTHPTLPANPRDPLTYSPTLVDSTPVHRFAPGVVLSFPNYELLDELGRGGMGVVYKARQRNLNRLVALKVILAGPHASDQDKGRFHLEAEAAGRLRHPNIVQVYDVGEHGGYAYIAFELVEGETLRQLQDGNPLVPREAARVVADVARAIQHAHDSGIVHRDLKPGNVLLASGGGESPGSSPSNQPGGSRPPLARTAKVTDFGLAKELTRDSNLTITGIACGTPNYMSPEQVRGAKDEIGPRTDVYGLGAVLFEALTGSAPFAGTDAARIMDMILNADPPPVRRLNPDVPRDLDVITAKCLEKDPARRYQSAAGVADDLERFLAGHPIHARAVGAPERAWRWGRRNPWAAAVLVVTSVGFAATATLAGMLAASERFERAAHAEADKQRVAAELAGDKLRLALAEAQAARTHAEEQKTAADTQAGIAGAEQKRAQESLRLARSVLRGAMDEFRKQPQLKEPAARELRAVMMRNTRSFARQIAPFAGKDPELLEELHALTMWVAYMEYLNRNMPAAATEYAAAADIARRWAEIDPDDPYAPLRRADALTNAGRAEHAAGRTPAAEKHLRDALVLSSAVAARHPRLEVAHLQFLETNAPLAAILRDAGRDADALAAAKESLRVSHDFVHRFGHTPRSDAHLAEAHFHLAGDLRRAGDRAAAECHLLESVELFDRVEAAGGHPTPDARDATDARVALADLYAARGRLDMARETFLRAAALARQSGNNPAAQLRLARVEGAHAEVLRRARQFPPAEQLFDLTIRTTEGLMRSPGEAKAARQLWAQAMTGRAHLYNATQRHRDAIREWGRLAKDGPDPDDRLRHQMFVLQSLIVAGDWRAAAPGAAAMDSGERPGWYWTDLARVWCRLAVTASEDSSLAALDRLAQSEAFVAKAARCLERAKAQGFFYSDRMAHLVETSLDYAVVRSRFRPRD